MHRESPRSAKQRILELLKTRGPATAATLAAALDVSSVAVRQHLSVLESSGLVQQRPEVSRGRGRPSLIWSLTDAGDRMFPDHHGALTVELISAMRTALGETGLERVIAARAGDQTVRYRALLPGGRASLKSRVQALAEQRTREGYMAEVQKEPGGNYLLIENHCPICEAAQSCTGLCRSELEVFQDVLGPDACVERTEHLMSGDRRCAYRIRRNRRK